jgi:hypothetical protein
MGNAPNPSTSKEQRITNPAVASKDEGMQSIMETSVK